MKSISVILILLYAQIAYAQEEQTGTQDLNYQFGAGFSADYDYRFYASDYFLDEYFAIEPKQIPRFGYTANLAVCAHFNPRFSWETGIQFAKKGYQSTNVPVENMTSDPAIPAYRRYSNEVYFLGVPTRWNWMFGKNKTRFICSTGLIGNVFLKEKITTYSTWRDGSTTVDKEWTREQRFKCTVSTLFSAGADFQAGDRSDIRVEAVFRWDVLTYRNFYFLWNAGMSISYYFGSRP